MYLHTLISTHLIYFISKVTHDDGVLGVETHAKSLVLCKIISISTVLDVEFFMYRRSVSERWSAFTWGCHWANQSSDSFSTQHGHLWCKHYIIFLCSGVVWHLSLIPSYLECKEIKKGWKNMLIIFAML